MDKGSSEYLHAQNRAKMRFGIELGPLLYAKMVLDIKEGRAKLLKRQSNRVSVFEVTVEGHCMVTVYDRKRKAIVTVLTVEQWHREAKTITK